MAEWLYEDGIGEGRAVLVDNGTIIEALVEVEGGLRVGAVVDARLGLDGTVTLGDGRELLCDPVPRGSQGSLVRVEIVREAIPEPGRIKRARARPSETALQPGASLRERIEGLEHPVRAIGQHEPDAFEEAGWSEVLESAASGEVSFGRGALRISLTPAMTLIDVDGIGDAKALALRGADAAGRAIRRFGIGGSIGVDLPSIAGKAARVGVGDALDAVLPPPFERTAMNGFGFVQVVRPRQRASLCEVLQFDKAGSAARALVRRTERSGLIGGTVLTASAKVIAVIEGRPEWTDRLSARLGGPVTLRAEAGLAISAGYATRS